MVTKKEEVCGTHLVGYVHANYMELVRAFGEPIRYEGGKVQVEWQIKVNGRVATIYDYKTVGLAECETLWHIGGHGPHAVEIVRKLMPGCQVN